MYTNTASSLDILKSDIENWLTSHDIIRGDDIVIQGDMQPEMKLVSAEFVTASVEDPKGFLNQNKFYPRLLLATARSIRAGLDSNNVHSVVQVRFPTSILEFVQEMGRNGRGRRNEDGVATDHVRLVFSCQDVVYLNQWLYLPPEKPSTFSAPILSSFDEIKLQKTNILRLL